LRELEVAIPKPSDQAALQPEEHAQPDSEASAILLDIEGTTTPIDFVYKVLFPYAGKHMETYVESHIAELPAIYEEYETEQGQKPPWRQPDDTAAAAQFLLWLMDQDRKSTVLKSVQGKIWERGFVSGELKGEVYPDVKPAFERWKSQGKTIAIFSSGSILAQKQLFQHSTEGDLTAFISAYFDTTTGPKRDPESYRAICKKIQTERSRVCFYSDVAEELEAARFAGLKAVLVVRPGTDWDGPTVTDFSGQ